MGSPPEPLPQLCRGYIYAIHGFFLEKIFAAMVGEDSPFERAGSLGSFLAYGFCGLTLERIYLALRNDCCLLTRCLLYILCIYSWELGTGGLLSCFGACPWDYGEYSYNLMGLIALEYFLFWFVGSLLLEKLVICNTLRILLAEPWKAEKKPMPRFELKDD
ncbi:transmembrane protein 229b-like [Sphaerodactylus townsendi]|uniref:transmembrane protein 229b-like n=1 Tax=Sphaerodactylus townsendi TaxID=933632 RepID=UPI00202600FF|nr:transmembrane protein 229b-like [Sphaerodactylus townsendi]XP_048358074.1 transmembrane protein 229b-like [Sphaerodactylus townsendi]XP_048358076.1 transmembrane protein 229b-like [Sphaerodactylus townsendi]XP_048358077.1 transmembrane protein 229b-like [Sphaerodactylus townsendi]XP_048358078.1 transmembrane protein 229b-like [Sphaerodactylus townsendi]